VKGAGGERRKRTRCAENKEEIEKGEKKQKNEGERKEETK